ncbi:histidine kinase [Bowmanella sp. Y26]|uniref:sensor histidine kinase n=1 Tax=Bowmanella yangjiangensis TaxID=2811230 RepID=UPI001BDC8269|nr:histidine kinase [Bowmanella yangjiangensis]MBT1064722.1 histidine kinase [Bowmanella yangjiangensis]
MKIKSIRYKEPLFTHYWRQLPGWRFFVLGLIFWLLMNSFSADLSYRGMRDAGKEVAWLDVWIYYLPWWLPWAVISPFIIAATRLIPLEQRSWLRIPGMLLVLTFLTFLGFLIIAVPLVAQIEMQGVDGQSLSAAANLMLKRGAWHLDFIVFSAVVCIGYSLQYYEKSRSEEARNERLLRQLMQLELESLKSQLNPHFLFNTLNTISSLVRLDEKQKAVTAISELSLMLRKVLENQKTQTLPLSEEIDFIQSYLTIQKMRFEDKLDVCLDIEPQCLSFPIPFMLLQPIVENAIAHGSQLESDKNRLELRIRQKKGYLNICMINRMPEHDEHHGLGIGLRNTRERLEKLYGKDFLLELKELDNRYFETLLRVPRGVLHVKSDDC